MDALLWCVLVLLALAAVWGWGELYERFVEPAKHLTVPGASPAAPYSSQDG